MGETGIKMSNLQTVHTDMKARLPCLRDPPPPPPPSSGCRLLLEYPVQVIQHNTVTTEMPKIKLEVRKKLSVIVHIEYRIPSRVTITFPAVCCRQSIGQAVDGHD